jgi:endonuclease/exonuclease/phosphatase family metal-dependent hydrolase
MPLLRIASYNVAWFAQLFDRDNRLVADEEWSAIRQVTRARQAEAIAEVLRRVDADCYAVIEAPNSGSRQSCVAELEGFAAHFGLRQRAALIGFENPTDQEIALLFDPDRIAAEHAPIGEVLSEAEARTGRLPFGAPRFDSVFPADLNGDGRITLHRFLKPPLEAVIEDRSAGRTLRLIAVHLKSKAPHLPGSRDAARRRAVEDRIKQRSQALWLRARLEEHMGAGEPVIALGDFNDGPGFDDLESLAGFSSVELVTGDPARPATLMVNRFAGHTDGEAPATARFGDDRNGTRIDTLIDFVMLSPDLAAATDPQWRIWHPDNDPEIAADAAFRAALLDASDHFPVSVDLELV